MFVISLCFIFSTVRHTEKFVKHQNIWMHIYVPIDFVLQTLILFLKKYGRDYSMLNGAILKDRHRTIK